MSLISRFLAALRGEWSPGSARASITPLRLSAELANTLLIDVREPDEWRSEHIAGAIHIPLGQLAQRVDSIDPERTVAVICRSGMRSRTATRILISHSIEAANVKGGMRAWTGSGLPVVRGAARGSR